MLLLKKQASAIAFSAALFFCACFSAQAGQCAKKEEKMALDSRVVQSEFMVAALTCNKQQSYNDLVRKFKSSFAESGRHLRQYFQRVYGSKANYNIDLFVTRLANEASQRSLKKQDYCNFMNKMFEQALSMSQTQFVSFSADQNFAETADIPACTSYKVAQQTPEFKSKKN